MVRRTDDDCASSRSKSNDLQKFKIPLICLPTRAYNVIGDWGTNGGTKAFVFTRNRDPA